MAVTSGANVSAATASAKSALVAGRPRALESAYAAIEQKRTCRKTTLSVAKTLLNRYREKGTADASVARSRSLKLSNVGRCTKNGGGKSSSSSSGLNAVEMM